MLTGLQVKAAFENFFKKYPEYSDNRKMFDEGMAEILGVSVQELEEAETYRMVCQQAGMMGVDVAKFLIDLATDDLQERQALWKDHCDRVNSALMLKD